MGEWGCATEEAIYVGQVGGARLYTAFSHRQQYCAVCPIIFSPSVTFEATRVDNVDADVAQRVLRRSIEIQR